MSLNALYDLPAPAKLNLFLHVVGRRPDGYHLLQSVFTLIDWCDTLHLERRTDGQLRRHDLGATLPPEDLCLKAAAVLRAASGCDLGVDISIAKQVPWGAGLGGGSSDAASVLLGLNRLWGLNWPRQRLLALAATLGADVPFFIGGETAFVEGIGERLTPLPLPRHYFAVIKPAVSIATPSIFSSPLMTRDTESVIVEGLLAELMRSPLFGRNDLQRSAEAQCPEVAEVGGWLESRYGNSRMTGSGSAVFSVVSTVVSECAGTDDLPVATWAQGELPKGWVGRMCRSLEHHPLIGWAD